jgi:hypothetical protein
MQITTSREAAGEVTILGQLLFDGRGSFGPELAHYVLGVNFSEEQKARMHDLAVKNQQGKISREELQELDNYINAGDLLAILKSKARMALKKTNG